MRKKSGIRLSDIDRIEKSMTIAAANDRNLACYGAEPVIFRKEKKIFCRGIAGESGEWEE